jgi:hypothetical protein
MILTGVKKYCMSSAIDETDNDMLWNGSGEDAHFSSQCEKDEDTVEMETGTLIGKGRWNLTCFLY